ncbi:MAG: SpoIIE family protein phosphatase, partial [Leptospiraceae bacterium]|nr:SpoIIE family protein phosphatase [Leptospiraceae bacterium]
MKSLFILLFLFLSSFFTLRAVPSINLIQDCETDTYTCKPRTWYYNPVFSDNFLRMKLPDSNWKPVKFPITVRSLHKGNETFIDYAFFTEINVTKEFLQKVSHPTIHLSYIGSAFSIYMNGKLIAKEGEFKDGQMTFYRALRHHNWPIDKLLFIEGKNFLLIRISGDPRYSGTGFYYKDGYHITEHAVAEYESRDWAGTILTFLYLAFGFYHLFLFIKRRQEVYNLTYALLSIDIFIYFICRIGIPLDYRGLDSMYIERMEYFFLFYANTLIYIFIDQLFERRISLFSKFCLFISLILSMAVLFAPAYFTEYLLLAWQISALLSVPYGFSVLIRHIKLKNKNAMALLIGLSMYIIVVIYDIANSMFLNYSIYLAKYAFFSFIVGIAVVLANRFLNLYETVEDLNENLERKVEKRTRELQHSFEEIKNLKEKQDGDYFLTTLLFKPLMSNVNKKANLKIEFLLKQKKQFQFKGKEHEIGGDICISDSIYLEEKEYAVFINGDAMGKSIQGAGGAIVLGVVFKSILSRTRLLKEMQKVSPEEWLKLAFIELQNVFESFDCSMLISIVMGLVDVETGMMYYINAEHPFICLYRDDKASFLDTELSLSKVGIPGLYNPIQVSTFTLNKDDVIIMGSDGRDDLKIEMG